MSDARLKVRPDKSALSSKLAHSIAFVRPIKKRLRFLTVSGFLILSVAIAPATAATAAVPQTAVSPSPTEVPLSIRTYSVLDVGKPGVPVLTKLQKEWLALIKRAPGYKSIWKTLRFLPMNDDKLPLTVFDPGAWWKDNGAWAGFQIIGDGCNMYVILDPRDGARIQPASECGPQDIRPHVPGEKALLGWDRAE